MKIAVKIKSIAQDMTLDCIFSFGVGVRSVCSFRRFAYNLEDIKKIQIPMIPKREYGHISENDELDFPVTMITPVQPITATTPPVNLPSINGKCLISDFICCFIFSIFIFPS